MAQCNQMKAPTGSSLIYVVSSPDVELSLSISPWFNLARVLFQTGSSVCVTPTHEQNLQTTKKSGLFLNMKITYCTIPVTGMTKNSSLIIPV